MTTLKEHHKIWNKYYPVNITTSSTFYKTKQKTKKKTTIKKWQSYEHPRTPQDQRWCRRLLVCIHNTPPLHTQVSFFTDITNLQTDSHKITENAKSNSSTDSPHPNPLAPKIVSVLDTRTETKFSLPNLQGTSTTLQTECHNKGRVIVRMWLLWWCTRILLCPFVWRVAGTLFAVFLFTEPLYPKPRVCGARVFSCNLSPAPFEEWPGSFACYCVNTGVKRIPKWDTQKVDSEMKHSPAAPAGIRTRDLPITSPAL